MAYPNKTIHEIGWGSYLAAAAITIYQRVKFVAPASSDGKPSIDVCAIGDRADGVAMAPIASGAWGPVRFLNAPGEQFGVASGSIGIGVAVYTAAAGRVSVVTGGGALLCGKSTSTGADGGVVTYTPIGAAA